jgi:hypothetical protein
MNTSALRAEINQRIQKDPQAVIRALRSAGVKLTKEDESHFNQKWVEGISDEQLKQHFNKEVLTALGIKWEQGAGQYGKPAGGQYGKQGGNGSNEYKSQPQSGNAKNKFSK